MKSEKEFLEFAHGSVIRGKRVVLHSAALRIPASGVVGLVGINGAGKTTLMLAIADLLRRRPWSKPVLSARDAGFEHRVGYSPQRPTFPAWLSTNEIVRMFGIDFEEIQASQQPLLLEELRGLRADRLSVGQSQALSIALALHVDTPVTLLDEPFAPLDFRRRVGLSELLQAHRASRDAAGVTIVSTQSAAELVDVCDWLLVLNAGRYVLSAPMHEVMHGALSDLDARSIVERRVMEALV